MSCSSECGLQWYLTALATPAVIMSRLHDTITLMLVLVQVVVHVNVTRPLQLACHLADLQALSCVRAASHWAMKLSAQRSRLDAR